MTHINSAHSHSAHTAFRSTRRPLGTLAMAALIWSGCLAVAAQAGADPGGGGRTPEQQEAALTFAQCVRDNGVPDFPDPATAQDPVIDTTKMRGGVGARSIPELQPAVDACHDFLTAALPGPVGTGRPA
ncbi:hypothetical protein [Mycolicibacterium lutetiense]|uniref:Lipoprotein LpqV n=1 Tax=Mycolicibacterium lutetiense TaxID=1641992 RepID=A0ABS5A1J0_9MYCO|nr:hypothetical protein [Mycolicibacterium lutetiense]MBP2454734.1 hypothetical protein [Mycolicibacterium lutetiense]